MKLLVKLGGTLLDADAPRESLAAQIAAAARTARMAVVHGGGKQMTRFLAERGVESQFVGGLRVTTPAVLDAVIKVVAGSVNRQLVAALHRAGARAVGISGIDGCLAEAEPMNPALGSVGRVTRVDPALLDALLDGGFLPVVACVAGDRAGRLYNVNADQMAAACAAAFGADQLVFLTDVDGVLDADRRILTHLTAADCAALMARGIATGGMQAKLNAARHALQSGVPQVRIAAGAADRVLARILAGEEVGTRLAGEEVAAR
ncbi:MAG TPA: acetylglutamate kinase [Bryobacteraceae bacterium]|nr:acetylglutamate kinase [Bryobacteraceae bacterium]